MVLATAALALGWVTENVAGERVLFNAGRSQWTTVAVAGAWVALALTLVLWPPTWTPAAAPDDPST